MLSGVEREGLCDEGPFRSGTNREASMIYRDVWRFMRRRPGFVAAAALSIALAVGANTSIFSIVDAIRLRPLPVADPGRLTVVYSTAAAGNDGDLIGTVAARYQSELRAVPSFSGVAFESTPDGVGAAWNPLVSLESGAPVTARAVSHEFFVVLGVPIEGRSFNPIEDTAATVSAVVSRRFWRQVVGDVPWRTGTTFGTTRGVVNIVGLAPERFLGPRIGDEVDVWLSIGAASTFSDIGRNNEVGRIQPLVVYARLANGASVAAAQRDVRSIMGRRAELRTLEDVAFPLRSTADLARQRALLTVLWLTAIGVLLLGCANLAGLLVARHLEVQAEIATRLALGGPLGRIVAATLAETLVLTGAGLAVGLGFRWAILQSLGTVSLPSGLRLDVIDTSFDMRTLAFSLLVAAVAAVTSVTPMLLQARRLAASIQVALDGRSNSARSQRMKALVLIGHVSLCFVLLVQAVALTLALRMALGPAAGFNVDGTLFVSIRPRATQFDTSERRAAAFLATLGDVRNVAGIIDVSVGPPIVPSSEASLPAVSVHVGTNTFSFPVALRSGGVRYLSTVGARFLEGRDFAEADAARALDVASALRNSTFDFQTRTFSLNLSQAPLVIVDSQLAQRLWPGESAVGKRLSFGGLDVVNEVIGTISPIDHDPLGAGETPTIVQYQALSSSAQDLNLAIHYVPGSNALESVRSLVRAAFPDAAHLEFWTGRDLITSRTARQRMIATVMSWYAAIAIALGLVGVAGLTRNIVQSRRREVAIRCAIGATPGQVRRLIVAHVLASVGAGMAVGCALVPLVTGVLRSSVTAMSSPGLWSYLAGAVLLAGPAYLVSYVWSNRVTSLNIAREVSRPS